MSNIDKEWLQQKIADMEATRDEIPFGLDEDDSKTLAALRIALASLEAEPRGYIDAGTPDDGVSILTENKLLKTDIALYTAPPAPANSEPVAWLWSHRKHPSEVTLVRPEDDERAEGAHWSGWSCQALYAAPPATESVPDYPEVLPCPVMLEPGLRFGKGVNTRTMLGALQRRAEYHAELEAMTPEQRAEYEAGMKEFAAMLQGAEPVTTAYKLRDAVDAIRNSGIAIDGEKILAERDALNSPVIPDGWVMVPKEPTEHMIVEGFESEPDEFFSDEEVWEAYDAMSGCQQAAHRAKLCWAAMIAAAPQQEVK